MTELLPNIWAFRVPKDAKDYSIVPATSAGTHTGTMLRWKDGDSHYYVSMPSKGNYTIIGVGISEEVAGKIVGTWFSWYKDYESTYAWFRYSTDSLISLLKSKGLNTEDNYVFLKLND